MFKIYTPNQWTSFFKGCPELIIDDDGYIYSGNDYYKLLKGPAIGKIQNNKIYGDDYLNYTASPIGYIKIENDVTEIYAEPPGIFCYPVYYVKQGQIYTPNEYLKLFGGIPSAHVTETSSGQNTASNYNDSSASSSGSSSSSSHSGFSGIGCGGVIFFYTYICCCIYAFSCIFV